MQDYMNKLHAAADYIREKVGEADIGVILGSGLGDYVEALEDAKYVDYKDIPGFPLLSVQKQAHNQRNIRRNGTGFFTAGHFAFQASVCLFQKEGFIFC